MSEILTIVLCLTFLVLFPLVVIGFAELASVLARGLDEYPDLREWEDSRD